MPTQKSSRGEQVTSAPFTAPFQSTFTRFGLKGLNINDAIDAVEPNELTRMLNVTHRVDASVTARSGQTNIYGGAVGTKHHSIKRLNSASAYTRVLGVDSTLQIGAGSLTQVASGFTGYPLSMLQYHPPLSGDSWMYVADDNKMVKVRQDGLTLPLGLPAPSTKASTALGFENKTVVANFTDDGTQVARWTSTPGFTYDNPPVKIDGASTTVYSDSNGDAGINFHAEFVKTNVNGYYAVWGCNHTVNMNKVGGLTASDDDFIHLRLNFSHTAFIKEFRLYFVISPIFSPSQLPGVPSSTGASIGAPNANTDFYLKSFSANSFSAYVQAQSTQINSAEDARIMQLRDAQIAQDEQRITSLRQGQIDGKASIGAANTVAQQLAVLQQTRTITSQQNAGSDQGQDFGVIGLPLRRGDFQRVGQNLALDWSNVTGIICAVITAGNDVYHVGTVEVRLSNIYMTGGEGPDSAEVADSPYDYRYTHYDPRTGAESNPSPVMDAANSIDSLRRTINVTPTSYSDGAVRQKFYRRGGTLPTDWFYVGTNTANGGVLTDNDTDTAAVAAGSVETDNYQPVPTVDTSGTTVLNQPLNQIWGPLQDLVFGCGDPYRPGHVYFCKPGNMESWPDDYHTEVTAPSEPILTGCLYGGQAFCFSPQRAFVLYPNFSGDIPSVTAANTQCTRGPVSRWAVTPGIGGMYFVASDGIYRTVGGPEEWMSAKIDPLFNGESKNGLQPIDFSNIGAIRLTFYENELYFTYSDTSNVIQTLVYSIPYQFWRQYRFAHPPATFYADELSYSASSQAPDLLIGGNASGKTYAFSGTSDDGAAISCSLRTGAVDFAAPRMEKRFGDQSLDMESSGVTVTLQNLLDFESITNTAATIVGTTGRQTVIWDDFGSTPQRAKNVSSNISWSAATTSPIIYNLGTTVVLEPDVTINRVTQWDDLGAADEVYLTGVTFDCDTSGVTRSIIIERDFGGAISTVTTLTVNANGRHKLKFSWPAVQANQVRIRPNDDCKAWILYRADWIASPEPPRIAGWDNFFENAWDQYYTGLDLFCDTGGADKTIQVYVDGTLIKTETVNTNGRKVHHITLPWGRGHVFHFVATDANPGLLYDFRWQVQEEPSEQTNWNQNFTTQSALYDKWLKAIVVECDTFGVDKTVTVECDGVVVETLTINADGRKVVQKSFPQHLGRVFRVYPTDDNLSRLYSLQMVFDGEPFALDRWETQEGTQGIDGWSYATHAHVTLKSTATVTFSLTAYNQSGTATTKTYTIASTAGQKVKVFLPFQATKGILHKYTLTSSIPFTLYQEETTVYVQEWGSGKTAAIHPFGDSDQDPTRNMFNAALSAARPGGTARG